MKTGIVFFLIIFFSTSFVLQASKPIPSFHNPVSRVANFTEKHHDNDSKSNDKGRRYMVVVTNVAGPYKPPLINHTVIISFSFISNIISTFEM